MLYKQISIKFSSVVCFLMGILVLAALLWGNNGQGAAVAQWVQPGADELSSSLSQVVRTDADADKANAYTLMTCTPLTDPAQIPSPTHIDFDELADGFVIGDHYQALRGVSFEDSQTQRTEATFSVLAHSRFNVAMNQPVPPHVSNNSPMLIQFDSPRTHVGFYVGNSGGGDFTAIVRAYNVDGQELCFYDMEPVPDDHTLFMGIFDTTGSISSVTLDYGDTAIIESIDDLYFSAAPLPPTATATATSTATAPPTNTPTPTATPTATTPPTPTNTPTPTATPTPITDLVADELEITQGIQNLDNEVFLVAGKRTFVRFYVHSTGGNHLTIARLKLQKGNQSTTVYPIAPGGPYLKVRPSHLRLLPGHAFLFELPKDFREGLVSIKAEVNFTTPVWRPTPNPYETNYNNNSISKLVWFEPMPTVPVVIARQPYRPKNSPGDYYSSTFYDEWMLFSWLKRAYPVNTVQLYLRTLPLIQNATRKWIPDTNDPSIGGYALTYPNCDSVNAYLYVNKSAVINSWFYHKNIHLVGIVSDEYGFMRGCAWGGVASGPSGSGTWGWDFDGTYADWYGAHELAHTYNRPHTLGELPNGCGEKDTVQQYTNGYISPISDLFERKAMYGFDPYFLKVAPYHNPILGPVWHDVMTYCDKQWVSDITYTGLRDYLKTLYTLPNGLVAHSAQTSITDRLAVFGSINMQTGELATLLPMSVWFNADDIEPRIPGAYAIVLLDADQNELARYPFTPDMGEGGSSPLDDVEVAYAGISELVPYVADTTHVNIEGPGGALMTTVSAGLAMPTVQLLTPNGGEVLITDLVTVTWTAVDTDNDPLSFNVYYSPDSGTHWDAVAMAITDTQVTVPSNNLMGSSSGLFRIEASDGIHTTSDTSDAVFTIPNHLPTVTIFTPETDVTIAVSQTLALEAFAYDAELGSMDDDLVWSSSLDGVLGNGSQLSTAVLSAGVHLVTIQANDGQGGSASESVTVTVVATPDDLPPTPDALLVAPHVITLYSAGGLVTTTLGIDNQNPLHDIIWQAIVDQPWLSLNISAGTTFTAVTLQANAAGLAPGTYQATLTISSTVNSSLEVVVPVTLIVEPYINYLPAVTR